MNEPRTETPIIVDTAEQRIRNLVHQASIGALDHTDAADRILAIEAEATAIPREAPLSREALAEALHRTHTSKEPCPYPLHVGYATSIAGHRSCEVRADAILARLADTEPPPDLATWQPPPPDFANPLAPGSDPFERDDVQEAARSDHRERGRRAAGATRSVDTHPHDVV